jgi:Mg2+-importing ATPase
MKQATEPFWSKPPEELLAALGSSPSGLSSANAAERLARFGPNTLRATGRRSALALLLQQFRSPISILLLVTAVLSAFAGEATDAAIILAILIGSGVLGFWQEHGASKAIEELLAMIRTQVRVRREAAEQEIALEEVVPGDIVVLNAGDSVPADCRLLLAKDLAVDEAALTGESFPAEKDPASVPADAPVAERAGALFMGTHVVSGTATAVVVATGSATLYGELAGKLERRAPESEFERGVRRFGYLLLEVTLFLVLVIFAINVALHRPVLDAFLFTLALAVGLTPQLLPAIVSITLAHGARRMARQNVVVRRLVAIEDFGGMSLLCTDKTGTLTEGVVRVTSSLGPGGTPSEEPRRLACLNARFQAGFDNPIDAALKAEPAPDTSGLRKLDEVPYDFVRRRLSVLLAGAPGAPLLITKGAVQEVLAVCTSVRNDDGTEGPLAPGREAIGRLTDELGRGGLRCLGVAYRRMDGADRCARADEREMVLAGVLALSDPPKPGIGETLDRLRGLGVQVKMVTGDNRLVAAAVAREVGMRADDVATGGELLGLTGAALFARLTAVDVVAEVDPGQKEGIILALKRGGVSVGYLGDGINDAASLHAADVGISVDTAVDVAKQAAGIVLLKKDLGVLALGIQEGRRAFANTLKYVFASTSANFGNMFSMAGASLLVPFLPMLPKQILLLNLLGDLPAMAIATDELDPEMVSVPRRWDVRYIRDFMVTFGLVSSVFDYLTFGLLLLLAVPVAQFRTGWFAESLLSEILMFLVIRTRRVFYRSRPSRPLFAASLGVAALALAIPYLPGVGLLGMTPLPARVLAGLLGLTLLLLLASEGAKGLFFRRHPLTGSAALPSPPRPSLP